MQKSGQIVFRAYYGIKIYECLFFSETIIELTKYKATFKFFYFFYHSLDCFFCVCLIHSKASVISFSLQD